LTRVLLELRAHNQLGNERLNKARRLLRAAFGDTEDALNNLRSSRDLEECERRVVTERERLHTQPKRQPGATVFEKVSSRTTRPSVSTERYDGTSESRKA